MNFSRTILIFLGTISTHCYADLPLAVENLISNQGKFSLESGLLYGNSKANQTELSGSLPIQIGTNSYINLPTDITTSQQQSDYLIGSLAVKYGISHQSDIGIRANASYIAERDLAYNRPDNTQSTFELSDISITTSHQVLEDDKYPALVAFADMSVVEKRQNKNTPLANVSIGLTTYRSYDPIVLSLTTGYKYNFEKYLINNQLYKPSDIFFINPQVVFAANDKISLLGGINFKHIAKQTLDKKTTFKPRNATDIVFGIGYGLDNDDNINLTAIIKQDFNNTNELRLSYSKKFK